MLDIGHLFILSVALFLVLTVLLLVERKLGRRVFLAKLRGFLDKVIVKISGFLGHWLSYLGRHILQLAWHYGVHRFLRFILSFLVVTYDKLETIFLRNRDRAKMIKKEKKKIKKAGHLGKIADHKVTTALTESQKKKLLAKKLEKE